MPLQVRLDTMLVREGFFPLQDLCMTLGNGLRTLELPLPDLLDVYL